MLNTKVYLKRIALALTIIIVSIGGFFAYTAYSTIQKISAGTGGDSPLFSLFKFKNTDPGVLKGEGSGRVNFLILGMGGVNHKGGMLTDTIMIASLDKEKKLALLSIPRDLYVPIPGFGNNKINAAHSIGVENQKTAGGGPELAKKTVEKVLDLPIQYYVRVDFQGFVKLIDALGGIDIYVDKAINDPYYPDKQMEGYEPFYISAGQHHMDGALALKYARSRETTSDFDRTGRQVKILKAVKEKALSLGVLANPKKIYQIFTIAGEHIKTDLSSKEMEYLLGISQEIDTTNIITKVLDNSPEGPLTTADNLGGYYLIPKAGINNFTQIQRIAHEIFTEPYLAEEQAKIEILNGTNTAGLAKEVADTLQSYGYQVISVDNATESVAKTVIYDYTNGAKKYTIKFLKDRFGAMVVTKTPPAGTNVDLLITIGLDYESKTQSSTN